MNIIHECYLTMKLHMDKFNVLRIFLMVENKGGFAAAAQALGSDPSTISKAINRLEKDIGFRLFQRSTRSLILTKQGFDYKKTVNTLFNELNNCEEKLRDENTSPTGTLKINTPVAYGRLYIAPMLPKFKKYYPNINIQLSLDDNHLDMIEHRFDLSIRTGSLQDNRLVAQKLSTIEMVTAAAPSLALTQTAVLDYSQKDTINWLQFRFKQSGKLAPIYFPDKSSYFEPVSTASADDGEALVEWCQQGMGYIQLPHFLVRHALLKQQLVPVMETFTSENWEIYVLYPKREFLPARTKLFIEFLKKEIEAMGESPNKNWARDLTPLRLQNNIEQTI